MRIVSGLSVVLFLAAVSVSVASNGDFKAFLGRFEAATTRFLNGDAAQWKQIASHRDDVTLMGAWGAYEKSWGEVGPRYDWAVSRFVDSGARMQVEYLASGESGDLAYTIAI